MHRFIIQKNTEENKWSDKGSIMLGSGMHGPPG